MHTVKSNAQQQRKPYAAPEVTIHGNLTALTMAVSDKGSADGGTKAMQDKT